MAPSRRIWSIIALALAFFAFYLVAKKGASASWVYVAAVVSAYRAGSARGVWAIAFLCSFFAVLGAFAPAGSEEPGRVLVRAAVAIWLPALPCATALSERAERQRLASVIHWSGDAISTRSLDGRVTSWNLGAESLYGYTKEEMVGRTHSDLVPADRLDEIEDVKRMLERGESLIQYDTVRLHKDGHPVDVSITISPIRNTEGDLVGISTIARNQTERKRLAEAQRRLNEELERRVAEKTADWVRANEALERSNAELRQFAYVASHDLQTPLRTIAGFAQFVQEDYRDRLDEEGRSYLDRITRGAKRMQELIQDLLELSRVEANMPQWREVDLRDVCREVIEMSRRVFEECGGEIVCGEMPRVRGDRTQLVQLVQNLVDNALKYRSEAPPRVSISATSDQNGWQVAVADNGIGIPREQRVRIFEIFKRLHNADAYPGTGIGLAICLRIVRRHGGRIWVEENEGGGSVFLFTLPTTAVQAAPPEDWAAVTAIHGGETN